VAGFSPARRRRPVAHFGSFFKWFEQLTTVGVQNYTSARLKKVTRQTIKHELSALRRLTKWAHERGYLAQLPHVETPGRRVLGTPVPSARKRVSLIFTVQEIARIVAHLPEYWSAPRAKIPYPVRARYIFAWETALRPRTIGKLEAPTDYRKGATTLIIRDEVDKNHFGRELPLSAGARAALDSVCPQAGRIFGEHDCVMLLRRAAELAGIDVHRAARISDYDFRHSAATHLGRSSDNLSGLMYLLGHKQPATTARYMRPQKDAAAEVLGAAAAGAEPPPDSGRILAEPQSRPVIVMPQPRQKNDNSSEGVRGGGLEPPWLLTASTSIFRMHLSDEIY
jgi:integrase